MATIDTITLKEVSTGYRIGRHEEKVITSGINAALHNGELTCLIGPNGAGKSTLLRTLSGFIPPIKGEIMIGDIPLDHYTSESLAKEISIVLTDKLNVPDMTLAQLVGLGRSPYTNFWGILSEEDKVKIETAIHSVGVSHLADRNILTLSDGERQKALIAKALAQETPIIFLDEPTAFLDYPSKVEIMLLLSRLAKKDGKTIFLSTHDLDLALELADTVWLINRDNGVVTGTPEDLALAGNFEKYFKSDDIEFNYDTGSFKIKHKLNGRLMVKGDGRTLKLLVKSLNRVGYAVEIVDKDADIVILEDGRFQYRNNTCGNIGQLLEKL